MRTNQESLEKFYIQSLDNDIIEYLAENKKIDIRLAMDIYYRSLLCKQIHNGENGIQYLDYKYLAEDLIENEKELFKSFESNLRITLIIDELTQEQKDTLSNVVKSFKLDGNREIEFKSYIVRLEQKIGIVDKNASFALSYQE